MSEWNRWQLNEEGVRPKVAELSQNLTRVYLDLTPPWIARLPQCPTWIGMARPLVAEPLHSQVEAVVGPYFRERDAVDRILIEGALQNLFRSARPSEGNAP